MFLQQISHKLVNSTVCDTRTNLIIHNLMHTEKIMLEEMVQFVILSKRNGLEKFSGGFLLEALKA